MATQCVLLKNTLVYRDIIISKTIIHGRRQVPEKGDFIIRLQVTQESNRWSKHQGGVRLHCFLRHNRKQHYSLANSVGSDSDDKAQAKRGMGVNGQTDHLPCFQVYENETVKQVLPKRLWVRCPLPTYSQGGRATFQGLEKDMGRGRDRGIRPKKTNLFSYWGGIYWSI